MSICAVGRVVIALAGLSGAAVAQSPPHGPAPATVAACFTPASSCAEFIADAIDGAQREVRMQAYYLTSTTILRALSAAKSRGLDVAVILDRSQDRRGEARGRYSSAVYLVHAGVPVWIDAVSGIAHNKVVVIDGHMVITGSFNFTKAADSRNAENVVLIDSQPVAEWFLANWQSRQAAADRFDAE